jgi:hypothetical protein
LRKADCLFNQEEKIPGILEDSFRLVYNSFRLPCYRLRPKSYSLRLVSYILNSFAWSLRLSAGSRIVSTVVSFFPATG